MSQVQQIAFKIIAGRRLIASQLQASTEGTKFKNSTALVQQQQMYSNA